MEYKDVIYAIVQFAQVIGVIGGIVASVISFNEARKKEALARHAEAVRPFLELRQNLFREAVKAAGVLANADTHSKAELRSARKRFRELYVTELSMVEGPNVASRMRDLAEQIDPELLTLTPAQEAAYDLAHALRDTFLSSWGIEPKTESRGPS